ncbi:amino acid transporter [Gigaspora margarita]|uniref:Amino acid transporter n=1 Tax=Gigaspora margarita TaxID=4874 RepID=A0A8H4B4Q6_GIGMA|nr:amino acid transporter [Gigaspora margarita]
MSDLENNEKEVPVIMTDSQNKEVFAVSERYNRLLGIFSGMPFSINIIIGSGIFVLPGDVWRLTRSPKVALIFWVIGGIISFFGSLIYAELGYMLPRGAGELRYLEEAFPNFRKVIAHTFSVGMITIIRPAAIVGDTYICAHLGDAMIKVLYAYEGWNNVNYLVDELHSPRRNLVVSNIFSILVSIVLYILINISYIMIAASNPAAATSMYTGDASKIIAIYFGEQIAGKIGNKLISALIAISSFGAVGSMVFTGSRVIVYSSVAKFIPEYFAGWGLNAFPDNFLFNTPTKALIAQFIYCSLLILFFPTGTSFFIFFATISLYLTAIYYGASTVGLMILKEKYRGIKRPFKVRFLDVIFLVCIVLIAIAGFFPLPGSPLYYLPYVISWVAVILGGISIYVYKGYKKTEIQ